MGTPELVGIQAVEEFLRWETPVMAVARIATRDTEIAGCPVHEGDQILALIGAANVDDSEFVNESPPSRQRAASNSSTAISRSSSSSLSSRPVRVIPRS